MATGLMSVLGTEPNGSSCSFVGLDSAGKVVVRRRVSSDGLIALLAKLQTCIVVMQAP